MSTTDAAAVLRARIVAQAWEEINACEYEIGLRSLDASQVGTLLFMLQRDFHAEHDGDLKKRIAYLGNLLEEALVRDPHCDEGGGGLGWKGIAQWVISEGWQEPAYAAEVLRLVGEGK